MVILAACELVVLLMLLYRMQPNQSSSPKILDVSIFGPVDSSSRAEVVALCAPNTCRLV